MGDIRIGVLGLDISGNTRVLRAVTTGSAGLALLLGGVGRVEPEHVGVVLERVLSVLHCFTAIV